MQSSMELLVNEFFSAIEMNKAKVVQDLLTCHPNLDPSIDDNYAIRYASDLGHVDVVSVLLAHPGVDASADHNIALRLAAQNGYIEVVKILLADPRVIVNSSTTTEPAESNGADFITPSMDEERKFKCKVCSRSFSRLFHLQRHEYTHSGEKPFQCSLCGYSFARSDKLKEHEKAHSENCFKPRSKKCLNRVYKSRCLKCFFCNLPFFGEAKLEKWKAHQIDCIKRLYPTTEKSDIRPIETSNPTEKIHPQSNNQSNDKVI